METIYVTIRIDYDAPIETDSETIAQLVCDRANYHNHTIEDGITIENVELCDINNGILMCCTASGTRWITCESIHCIGL